MTNTNFNLDTKLGKLYNALVVNGETLSERQIAKRFGIKNVAATVSSLRDRGFAIYANQRVAGNGVTVTEYRNGTPSRSLVALGYMAMRLGLAA